MTKQTQCNVELYQEAALWSSNRIFLNVFRTDGMIDPCPLCKRDQKLAEWCCFQFIRFRPSGCGGRFWTDEIQVLMVPWWVKASQSSLVFTLNLCKSHKFTLPVNSICPCSSLSPCTSSSVQLASYLNSSLLVRSCFTFLKCSYKLSLITFFPGKALQSIALTSPFYVWYHQSLIYFEIKWPAQCYKRKQHQSIRLKFRSASHSPPKDEDHSFSFSCLKIKPYEKKLKP